MSLLGAGVGLQASMLTSGPKIALRMGAAC